VDLCRWEDFNFSKAALCFSRKLTKDHVSVGIGVLVHQIGQAIAQGRPLSLDFRVGKLVMKERKVFRFLFSGEIMQMMEASPRRLGAAWPSVDLASTDEGAPSVGVDQDEEGTRCKRRATPTLRGSIWRRSPKLESSCAKTPKTFCGGHRVQHFVSKMSPESTEDELHSSSPPESPDSDRPPRPCTSDAGQTVPNLSGQRSARPCTSDIVPPRPCTSDAGQTVPNLIGQRSARPCTSDIVPPRPCTSDAGQTVPNLSRQRPRRPHTSDVAPTLKSAKRPCRPTSDVASPRPMLCKRGKQAFQPEPESSPRCNNMKECLDQRMAVHIKELEQRAIRAIGKRQDDKQIREKHEELEERRQRLLRLREHSDFLMKQMEDKEIRRKAEAEAERESVVTASTHSTPRPRKAGLGEHRRDLLTSNEKEDCASQLTEELAQDQLLAGRPRPEVLLGRLKAREELRDCLHAQMEARKTQRQEQERQRLEMEVNILQHESHIMELESHLQKAAKREEQESLKEAWSQECKLRDVHRRIEALEEGRVPKAPLF